MGDVQATYVHDDKSDPIFYLTLQNATPGLPTTDGNSYPKAPAAQVTVTLGLVPPLKDTPISDPPIRLRFGTGPSQTQALDCNGSGTGPNGWRGLMVSGCPGFQVNVRNGSCATPYPVPADCIDSENGNFNNMGVRTSSRAPARRTTGTVPATRRRRSRAAAVPTHAGFRSSSSTRWRSRFGRKRTYPIRRFGGFYITAGDGMNCPGDDPASGVKRTELWGHFVTYVPSNFGESFRAARAPSSAPTVHTVPRRSTGRALSGLRGACRSVRTLIPRMCRHRNSAERN